MEQKDLIRKYVSGLLEGKVSIYDFKNTHRAVIDHITYMLNRMQSAFVWNGLPDSIPEEKLELYLQTNGNVCFYKHDEKLYVFTGAMGGIQNEYYMPTKYIISNPYLKLSKELTINEDCIVMPNDSTYTGLLPLFSRYATGLAHNELSLDMTDILLRIFAFISAPDDRTKTSAEAFINKIYDGEMSVIAENEFLSGIKTLPFSNTTSNNNIISLIELEQYYKAGWYNDIGLSANYNMKRENLNEAETTMNNDTLLPLIDNMLTCRKKYIEKVNAMYGTEISVELSGAWKKNADSIEENSGQPETNIEETETENVESE